jgi:hypothetical protein
MINASCQLCKGTASEDQRHIDQQNATNGKTIRKCEIPTLMDSQLRDAIFCRTFDESPVGIDPALAEGPSRKSKLPRGKDPS